MLDVARITHEVLIARGLAPAPAKDKCIKYGQHISVFFQQTSITIFLPDLLSLEIRGKEQIDLRLKEIASFRDHGVANVSDENLDRKLDFFLNRCLHGPFPPLEQPSFSENRPNSFLDGRPGFG